MSFSYKGLCSLLVLTSITLNAQQNLDFPPSDTAINIEVTRAKGNITVDGILNETDWKQAEVVDGFFRREPRQNGKLNYPTQARFLFDDKYLYVGAYCRDTLGQEGIRIQDLRRDFGSGNDQFGIALDPQNLKQYAQVFETTPYGNQSDFQNFNGNNYDSGWNTLWKVRTSRTDSGYYAEFAIPFKSLRYDKTMGTLDSNETLKWGITMQRRALRDYEVSSFPAIPQALSMYRMTYAAQLVGLEAPPPSANIRVAPYTLYQLDNIQSENEPVLQSAIKLGGDAKWAINPHSVLDITVNTDFAQADLDQAVNNLERFNIFFPEQRQFFLENSGIWAGASQRSIRPFFSRRIGLEGDFNARPAPIELGTRYTLRTEKQTIAALLVRQAETESSQRANFGVGRYLRNYGRENNVGFMLTHRLDENSTSLNLPQNNNSTLSIDGQIRPSSNLDIQYLFSSSIDEEVGYAGRFQIRNTSNEYTLSWTSEIIDERYKPEMGFVRQNNLIAHSLNGYYIWRPKNIDWIRRWDPGVFLSLNQDATNPNNFQQASIYIFPVYLWFKNNSFLEIAINPIWQNINFDFAPLGLEIEEGIYQYNRFFAWYYSDQSKKLSASISTSLGRFYNGTNNTIGASGRYSPIPHVSLNIDYSYNSLIGVGVNQSDLDINLVSVGSRLALNPRVQLSTFYQYNSLDFQGRWNIRFSWEFQPLSFVYIVFNDSRIFYSKEPFQEQQLISKITYIKQF